MHLGAGLASRIFSLALILMPRWFRDLYGEDMRRDFAERARDLDAKSGRRARVLFELGAIVAVLGQAIAVRVGASTSKRAVDRDRSPLTWLAGSLEGATRDVRLAVRSARRAPWFSMCVVATLGVGIGVNVAIFSAVEAVLLRSPPFPEPDRIVYLHQTYGANGPSFGAVSPANYLDWESRLESFESMAAVASRSVLVTEGGDPERVPGARVSADYFRAFGVEPSRGRTFSADEDVTGGPNVVVVSDAFWSSRLGRDPDAVGRTVRLDGDPHTVIGVMPASFRVYARFDSPAPVELWRPYPFMDDGPTERAVRRLGVIARLRESTSLEEARAELNAVAAALADEYPDANEGVGATARPLVASLTSETRTPLLVLFGAATLVLLIACLNVGNLLLARADARRSSITLRRALGAGRARVVRQLLTESLILSGGGAVLGVGIAWALLPVLVGSSPIDLTRLGEVHVNRSVLGFSAALTLLTGLLAGLAPAFGITSPDLVRELKERGLGRTESRRARAGKASLVVAEVALSVVLLIGAALLVGTYARLTAVELGFDATDVVRVGALLPRDQYAEPVEPGSLPETRNFTVWRPRPEEIAFREGVQAELALLPGVESVGSGNFDPFPGLMWGSQIRAEGSPPPDAGTFGPVASVRAVAPGWLETVRIPIVRGRALQAADEVGSEDVVVLDEGAAGLLWPGEDPIGRSVMLKDGREDVERPFRIVGIAASSRQALFDNRGEVYEGDTRAAYIPYRAQAESYVDWQIGFRMRSVFLIRTERDLEDIGPEIRRVVASFDPELPITIERLADTVASPLAERRFYMAMLVVFGTLATLLAVSGVFSVMAYSVARKTRELGIRLALGAPAPGLLVAELARGFRLALLGLLIGASGAAWLTRFIESLLYGVDPVDPTAYAAVGVLIVSVVLMAAYLPARRAAATDAMESLRTE